MKTCFQAVTVEEGILGVSVRNDNHSVLIYLPTPATAHERLLSLDVQSSSADIKVRYSNGFVSRSKNSTRRGYAISVLIQIEYERSFVSRHE